MKLVDSKQPWHHKLLFFLGLAAAYFLFVNLTGDESWLLSNEEKLRRRAYLIAQSVINQTYMPPSPARFPPIDEVDITRLGEADFRIAGWIVEPDARGDPQRFDYVVRVVKAGGIWQAPELQFKALTHRPEPVPEPEG